jgi:hypothetical protein
VSGWPNIVGPGIALLCTVVTPSVDNVAADLLAGKVLLHLAVFVMEHRLAAEARAGINHLDVTAGELEEIRLMDGCGCCSCCAHVKTPRCARWQSGLLQSTFTFFSYALMLAQTMRAAIMNNRTVARLAFQRAKRAVCRIADRNS